MKALITGASGFIGSTLIEELDTLGFEVYALMRSSSRRTYLEGLKYQETLGDLSDFDSLCRAVKEVDYVFHLASASQLPLRSSLFDINARGTELLAKAVAQSRPQLSRFVYVSSLAAAGPAQSLQQPRDETEPEKPLSDYAESKLQGEKEVLKFKDQFPVSIIRPPIVYGPRDRFFFYLVQLISRNVMPIIQGSTQNRHKYYSLIHSKDLCRGIVQAGVASLEKVPSGEVFFMAGEGVHTYLETLGTIAEKLDADPLKITIPNFVLKLAATGLTGISRVSDKTFPLNLDRFKELVPDYWICSSEKAKSMLGFAPEFDLPTGLTQTIEWYKSQKWI